MKILLKSLEELKEEFTIEEKDNYPFLIIDGLTMFDDMLDLLGKVHIAEYEKEIDAYVIDGWKFPSNFIKEFFPQN